MPIVDIEIVAPDPSALTAELSAELADAVGEVFATGPGRSWVRLRGLPQHCYAENGVAAAETPSPVFVTVLKAARPAAEELAAEVKRLAAAVARICHRPAENVHVLYLPDGAGRVAFGGKLV